MQYKAEYPRLSLHLGHCLYKKEFIIKHALFEPDLLVGEDRV